jgi:two-component system, NtrC family, response regulator AtoC
MSDILIVDDEPAIRHAFGKALRGSYELRFAGTAAEAMKEFEHARPDAIVLDVHLPDATGLETFRRLKAADALVPVILMTGHGTTDLAIAAIMDGAFEYLLKPLELPELRQTIDRAVRTSRMMRTPARFAQEATTNDEGDVLVGKCPAMQEVYKAIGRVAGQGVLVLVRGESGTGKELVARAIYQHGTRAKQPFLAINCAAIPEQLLESELFGHERGAFTGAERKRIGKFEQCSGGTLFLDEVGEMTPLTQAKLLRVLQEQCFERLGGSETIRTDVRIIAATNADLEAMTADGRFRTDLYFRLNVFTITLPPLRERGEDVILLGEQYVRRYAREFSKTVTDVSPEVWDWFREYRWPGNVRELQSVVKQALLRMNGTVLLKDFLPEIRPVDAAASSGDLTAFIEERLSAGSTNLYAECLARVEQELIVLLLKQTRGNQLQTAKLLGITRGSLRTKIRALGIRIESTVSSEDEPGGEG